jgi:hypothetical protein
MLLDVEEEVAALVHAVEVAQSGEAREAPGMEDFGAARADALGRGRVAALGDELPDGGQVAAARSL